ncbi:MAG TPA: mechanosensitive ion channel domain-containing protein, partial [Pyrinomonadaceae bacterium]
MTRPPLKKQIALPLVFAAVCGAAWYVLWQFNWEPPPGPAAERERVAHAGREWALTLASIAALMGLALVAVRALNELVFLLFRKRKGYDAPSLMRDLFSLVCYVTAGAVILRYTLGLSFAALLPGSALLGIVLGLALQDTLGNLFSGISLHADKPFQVGDVITVGKHTGVVMSVTWRAVKLKTFQNHIVLVSNTSIA